MISFWSARTPDEPIPLRLPKRLRDGETVRMLGGAFDIMTATLFDGGDVGAAAVKAGYRHVMTERQTPLLRLESFIHDREEQRLILNTHRYPKFTRRVLQLTVPGGMTREAFERFRLGRDCVGATYTWRGHIYGEWRTAERPARGSPVFIELRQDFFQEEPLVLRVMFHQVIDSA